MISEMQMHPFLRKYDDLDLSTYFMSSGPSLATL